MRLQPSEHQIQTQIIGYLRYKGYYVDRMNAGKMRYTNAHGKQGVVSLHPAGTPDVMCFKLHPTGVLELLFLEIKVPGNKPTTLQQMKMKELEEYGAKCYTIHSIEDLEALGI